MSEWVESSTSVVRSLAQSIDDALGYPRPPTRVYGKQRPVARDWDGRGPVPWGWTVSRLNIRRVSAGLVALEVTDDVRASGVSLPATDERPANYLSSARRVDPIEDRPASEVLTLDQAYRRRWGVSSRSHDPR